MMSARWSGLFVAVFRRPWWTVARVFAVVLSAALVAGVLWVPPRAVAAPRPSGAKVPLAHPVAVQPLKAKKLPEQSLPKWNPGPQAWPAGGSGVVAVDASASGAARSAPAAGQAGSGRVGGLSVGVRAPGGGATDPGADVRGVTGAPGSVRLSVAGREATDAAGVRGVLFTAVRGDSGAGSARVALDLDYSGFANAYGGDYGRRLRLVRLPACVLSTPSRPECQVQTPVSGSVNNPQARVVSVDTLDVSGAGGVLFPDVGAGQETVAVGPPARSFSGKKNESGTTVNAPSVAPEAGGQAVYALVAAASSDAGDYAHTSLSPTYSWSAGTSGGEFSYNIPLPVPPTAAGPVPDLALQYSSSSVDGKTTSTNNQPSWIGEGWDLQIGYIERSFKTCGDDENNSSHPNDLCWFTQNNATMVFQGKSTRLVKDDSGDHWHGESDDGSHIELVTGQAWAVNGDHDAAYWRVTTTDGTQYYFGRNKRWAGDPDTTDSTQNVLVYGNNSGEPCYGNGSTPQARGCTWTYRWNLDYVVDPNGNSMTYYYKAFLNKYGNFNATSNYVYDATAIIKRIDYGTRADAEGEGPAPQQVIFGEGPRCSDFQGACATFPDVPWDLTCGPDWAVQCTQTSPSYWNPWRLVAVQTQVFDPAIGDYRAVDSWSITPEYPATGSGEAPSLWMTHLDHNGYTGGSTTAAPQLDFDGALLANRVNGGSVMNHYRLWRVKNLAGGVTEVAYEPTECTTSLLATIVKNQNPYRCFPDSAGTDWFHKYVVSHVTEHDLTGGGPDEVWDYQYSTAGANTTALWHFDNNEQASAGGHEKILVGGHFVPDWRT